MSDTVDITNLEEKEDKTLLGDDWNMNDSSTEESENEDENDGNSGAIKKNEYFSFRHVMLLNIDTLSLDTGKLFPAVSK